MYHNLRKTVWLIHVHLNRRGGCFVDTAQIYSPLKLDKVTTSVGESCEGKMTFSQQQTSTAVWLFLSIYTLNRKVTTLCWTIRTNDSYFDRQRWFMMMMIPQLLSGNYVYCKSFVLFLFYLFFFIVVALLCLFAFKVKGISKKRLTAALNLWILRQMSLQICVQKSKKILQLLCHSTTLQVQH